MVGGLISLMWCFIALAISMVKTTPRTSLFPEIDFASKVARNGGYLSPRYTRPGSRYSFQHMLSRLSNSDSYEIRRGLGSSKIYARLADPDIAGNKPFTLMSEQGGLPVSYRPSSI